MAPNELRVFVSSTFTDLLDEREHLVKKVFPEFRSYCRARGIAFAEVELRWGLTEERVVLGQMIRTCLQEIDRCRPYFIGILGDRYGYVPEIAEIYKDPELLRQYAWIEDAAMECASIVDLEFRHAALNNPDAARQCSRFFFRAEHPDASEVRDDERGRSDELKERLRAAGLLCVEFGSVDELGEAITRELKEIVDREFAGSAAPTALEEERARHRAFAESRRMAYIPNRGYLYALAEWLEDPDSPPLLLYGANGSGKSALVSFWCDGLRRHRADLGIVEHYVGLGAGRDDHIAIMRHVVEEIKERFQRPDEIPSSAEEIALHFSNWLGFTLGEQLLVIVDGLDHLDETVRRLNWLPSSLPPGIRLVLTSADSENRDEALQRGWTILELQPLTPMEREAVAVRVLAEYRKALASEQIRRIASEAKCSHPLFLRTLLDELRVSALHETLDRELDRYLSVADTEALFECVLERAETDFGRDDVRAIMSLLLTSRLGLDEADLMSLTGIAPLKLASIVNGLDYHLVRRDGLLTFFHVYLRRAVRQRYLMDEISLRERARQLAGFFDGDNSVRASRELIQQYQSLDESERLRSTLVSIPRFRNLWNSLWRYELLSVWSAEPPERFAEALERAWSEWITQPQPAEDRWQAMSGIAQVARMINAITAAEQWYTRLVDLGREIGDANRIGIALADRALMLSRLARLDEATAVCDEAIAVWRETFSDELLARALNIMGQIYLLRDEYEKAAPCFEEAEHIARTRNDAVNLAESLHAKLWLAGVSGDFETGLKCSDELSQIARTRGDRSLECRTAGALAGLKAERCDLDGVIEATRTQERIALELGLHGHVAAAISMRARAFTYAGKPRQAAKLFVYAAALNRDIGSQLRLGVDLCHAGTSLAQCGNLRRATQAFSEAECILRGLKYKHGLMFALLWHGSTLTTTLRSGHGTSMRENLQSEIGTARTLLQEALELAREAGLDGAGCAAELDLAQLDMVEEHPAFARDRLLAIVHRTTDRMALADAHYQLWKDALDPSIDHATEAREIYQRIAARTPYHDVTERLRELEEAVPLAPE